MLRLVDRKVHHFELGTIVTLACAVSTSPFDKFQVVSAGHPPPVQAEPGRPATLVDVDVRPPSGSGPASFGGRLWSRCHTVGCSSCIPMGFSNAAVWISMSDLPACARPSPPRVQKQSAGRSCKKWLAPRDPKTTSP